MNLHYVTKLKSKRKSFVQNCKINGTEFIKEKEYYMNLDCIDNHSENYGNLIVYNGNHCKVLINIFSKSNYLDDCIYLLHNIENDKKDVLEIKTELKYLSDFLIKFPNSNLKNRISERIKSLQEEVNSGNDLID